MNVVFITSVVVFGTLLIGILVAAAAGWFGRLVTKEQTSAIEEKERYNSAVTLGLEIPYEADIEEQMLAARKIAAINAAAKPRFGNMRVGHMGGSSQATAFDGVREDPVSAVKIASYHGWDGLQSGFSTVSSEPVAAVRGPAQTAPPTRSADDLVPGVDYTVIEITDDMGPAEIRKARIANAKAKSAAVKALKEAGVAAPAPPTAPAVSPGQAPKEAKVTAAAASPATSPSPSGEPVAGVDYQIIEITDEMDPGEKRSARIANAKAKSAAMKAFKESGGSVSAPTSATATPQSSETSASIETATTSPPATTAPVDIPSDIAKPDYIEITDDMDPADIRSARIANAKMKSSYNKALKAAGIDPSTVSE